MSENTENFDAAATILAMDAERLSIIIENDLPKLYETNREAHNNFCNLLLQHEYFHVRELICWHVKAPESLLLKALDDEDYRVRASAAEGPNATEVVLLKALDDKYYGVVEAAKRNRNMTPEILAKYKAIVLERERAQVARENAALQQFGINLG